MNRSLTSQRRLIVLALAIAACVAVCGVAFAQEGEGAGGGGGGGGGGAQAYVLPYALVLLCIGGAVYAICKPARRRDRPKGEEFKVSSLADVGKKEIPVIQVGMPMSQVNKLLGKPKVRRRGDDIYREAAQAGRLSEKDAAKEHLTYDHPDGQYKLVAFDRRVIEIKTQPKRKEDEAS